MTTPSSDNGQILLPIEAEIRLRHMQEQIETLEQRVDDIEAGNGSDSDSS